MVGRSLVAIVALGLLVSACAQGTSPQAPNATPYSTYTPQSTYELLPTGTPYPTQTALPTPTPYQAAPTLTPHPTYTPMPTSTPYRTEPTLTPHPTYTPVPTPTPYPTLTPQPTATPFPTPRPTPTPTPAPLLSQLHDTQNTRWLARAYPDVASRIATLPWVEDGISDFEGKAIDELVYLGADKIDNLRAVLLLPWVQDAISSTEYDILDRLSGPDPDAVAAMIAMPFLSSPDATDALAVRAVATLSAVGPLDALVDSPLFKNGIDDGETALVAALGSFKDADALRRVLAPGAASVEALSASTALTPALKISIIRTGSQSRPGTAEAVRDAVEFAEDIMGLPLPVEHVIVVLDVDAIPEGAAGANYDGFAISYSPEYETRQGTYEWRILQSGFTHEVAHYYWIGHASWIDEGLANVFEYMRGRADGLSPGQLKTTRRGCEAHDLKMLETWDVSPGDSSYICSYYLGERLFLELLEALGRAEFATRLGELYQAVEEVGDAASVIQVRQVFAGQESIVDRHWSGALNAPENRPFDEGVERTSHDLIQWDQHPTYDGHSVRFSGTLLDGAVLSKETIEEARQGGYQNFFLRAADAHDFAGHILPPFTDGTSWTLDAGDSVATTYSLDAAARSFTITFPFPEGLGTPSDYVVVVDGFQDDSRTPRMGGGIDNLGYARIRVE